MRLKASNLIPFAVLLLFAAGCSQGTGSEDHGQPSQGEATGGHGRVAGQDAPSASAMETRTVSVSGITFQVPTAWSEHPPSSMMRKAQLMLPPPEEPESGGDPGIAEVVLFFFGAGQGGDAESNITRWLGQFQTEEGEALDPKSASRERFTVNELTVTTVRAHGNFVAPVMPGAPEQHDESDWALYGAIVEGDGGPWFFKATGPQSTMDHWDSEIRSMYGSVALDKAEA